MRRSQQLGQRLRGWAQERRKGAMLVLIAAASVILMAMAMFSVDVSFIQLTRTELRAATDAAAKAGAAALTSKQSTRAAVDAAIEMAAKNQVNGRSLVLSRDDIEIGSAEMQLDGSWEFVPDGTPASAVRVIAQMKDDNANGAVPLFFAGLFGSNTFQPSRQSTASNMEQDICLVLDRSHSMCFDLTGVEWSYPSGVPLRPHPICYAPHPSKSRWAALANSVQTFLKITKESSPPPRLALVTWGSEIGKNTVEYLLTRTTEVAVATEVALSTNHGEITSAINGRSNKVMLGGTNMSAGIDAGVAHLLANARPLTAKTMILMTDGQWNQGRDPIEAAAAARDAGIVIHTITFLRGAESATMEEVATITGGRHYHADRADDLEAAFEELARTLPVVLTE